VGVWYFSDLKNNLTFFFLISLRIFTDKALEGVFMENDMLDDFRIEAEELFDEAEESLLEIEKSDDYQSCFNSIFRAFHSVKGAAGMFGIDRLQEHMHFVENLLEQKKDAPSMSSVMIDYLLNAVDSARKILRGEDVSFKYYDPDNTDEKNTQNIDLKVKKSIEKEVDQRNKTKNIDGTIMLVDDEEEILLLTQAILEEENFKVITYTSAVEALKNINKDAPDMIISDIKMPEMDGLEFMKEVNKIKPHLPFVLMSGFVTKESCLEAMACGISGVLEKPFEQEHLVSMANIFINRYKNLKLMNTSLDLLLYQFEDYDKFLLKEFGAAKRDVFRAELKSILKQKKLLFEKLN
jgi:CheY-like chemotaxis protein